MTIRRFEDLESWKESRSLAGQVYAISNQGAFASDFCLRDQLRKSAVSIMANIAAGFGRGTKAELIRFLWISHASALETQSHLYVARDLGYLSEAQFDVLHRQATKVSRLVGVVHSLPDPRCQEPTNTELRNQGTC